MNTTIFTKKHLIEWLNKNMDDDHFILHTKTIRAISINKKSGLKFVDFGFAINAFRDGAYTSHIVKGQTPVMALCLCKKEDLSENALKIAEEMQDRETEEKENEK